MRRSNFFAIFSILLSCAVAHEDALFTSSVSYCAPPEAILIQQFDISYVASNSSVVFNVTAASVEPNLTVSANVILNEYGNQPVNLTIDFCQVLGDVLCPLPQYNFMGAGSVPLPSGLNVVSKLPGIAYKIPDLEAFAQVTLVDVHSGEVKACIQTTLSNGWSTRQPSVSWATGGLALVALIGCLYHILRSHSESMMPQRFLDLLHLYQHICFTGLLDINYPIVYTSYTLNFSWAIGLFAGSDAIQRAINSMRTHTGGHVDSAVSPTGTINRKLSPYNSNSGLLSLLRRDTTLPATVTSAEDSLPAGIPTYSNFLGIAQANAFMSIFFTLLILIAIMLAFFLCFYGALWLWKKRKGIEYVDLKANVQNNLLLLAIVCFAPITTFSFYQWTLHDSWLSALLSAISFLAVTSTIAFYSFSIIRTARLEPFDHEIPVIFQPLIGPYRFQRYWYFVAGVLATLLKAIFIGFGQRKGIAQVIGLLIIEVLHFGILILARPFRTRRSDALAIFLGLVRVVTTGLLIPFITRLQVKPIPRVVIGIVNAIILSVAIIIMFLDVLKNILPWHLIRRRKRSLTLLGSDDNSLEKKRSVLAEPERPPNPTPSPTHSQLPNWELGSDYASSRDPPHYTNVRPESSLTIPSPSTCTSYGTIIDRRDGAISSFPPSQRSSLHG